MTLSSSAGDRGMQREPAEAEARIGLSAQDLAALFPFHFVIGPDLVFRQVGKSLSAIGADLCVGTRFADHFELVRPNVPLEVSALVGRGKQLVLLEHRSSGTQLRGQFVSERASQGAIFVGSPWFTDSGQISAAGLSLRDFAPHDPVFDLLLLLDGQRVANEDLKRFNARLAEKQARLSLLNEQLSASEAEARKLALVASHTANAVIIADAQGRAEWVNAGFTRLSGFEPDEILGRTPGSLLQCEDSDAEVVAHMRESIRKGRGFETEVINRHKSGKRYWVAIEVRPIFDEGGAVQKFIAIESDITERKMSELRQEMQYAVASRLTQFGSAAETARLVLSDIANTFGWRFAALWQPTPDGAALHCAADWMPADEGLEQFREASRSRQFAPGEGLPGRVWASGEPARVCDVTADDNFPRAASAAAAGLQGGYAFPIHSGGEFIGVVEFFCCHAEIPDEALTRALEAVCNQLGLYIVRRREEDRARRLSAELNAIFDLNPDAFVAFDADGRLSYANPTLTTLTGMARTRGTSIDDFDLVMRSLCEQPALFSASARQPCEQVEEIVLARPRATVLQRAVRDISSTSGEGLGRVLYLRDVTHEKEVERMKSEFLSTAAHELRTPMASIYGFTELLMSRGYDEATRHDVLSTINRQAGLLTRMVNELLDLARIEARAGRDFNISPQPLLPLVQQVMDGIPAGGQAERLCLRLPDESLVAQVDADKFIQALTNLVSNAFKYSPKGGAVELSTCRADSAGHQMLGIQVRDHGIGMSPEQCARATERFYRADPSGNIPGTGLGLSLVREIAEIMGGRLEIESELGKGTAATLWLRVA